MGLLRSATAFEAYCKVYTADVTPDRILEFLLLDEEFPHSIRFSIDTLQNALEAIHGEGGEEPRASRCGGLPGGCRRRSATPAWKRFSAATWSPTCAAFSISAARSTR